MKAQEIYSVVKLDDPRMALLDDLIAALPMFGQINVSGLCQKMNVPKSLRNCSRLSRHEMVPYAPGTR